MYCSVQFSTVLGFSDESTSIKLRESYTKPKYLASCLFAWLFLVVGTSAPNALIFANYMVTAFDPNKTNDPRLVKFIALVCITFVCLMHLFSRKVGIYTSNRAPASRLYSFYAIA